MNAVIRLLWAAAATVLGAVLPTGCEESAKPELTCKIEKDTTRRWPDMDITGGDFEVLQLQHLLVDKKVIDVWTDMIGGTGVSRVRIVVGLREHTLNDLKDWEVRIASPTMWLPFTTGTFKLTDGRFAQHPDYKNGVVVFRDTHEFYTPPQAMRLRLPVGSHTATVELIDEKDRVQGVATFNYNVHNRFHRRPPE